MRKVLYHLSFMLTRICCMDLCLFCTKEGMYECQLWAERVDKSVW